jgi:opacity protein-like surface antigen
MMCRRCAKSLRIRAARRPLRLVAALAAVIAAPAGAHAADVAESFLRGAFAPPSEVEFKPSAVNWEGPYVGVDIGRSFLDSDMSDSASEMIEKMLRNTTVENEGNISSWPSLDGSASGNTWGGFVGYNWQQLSGIVLGLEGAYHMASDDLEAFASDRLSRVVPVGGGSDGVTLTTNGRFAIKDYATIRGRVGYVLGQFLPYASLGVSIARVSYRTHARVDVVEGGQNFTFKGTTEKDDAVAYGANLALGADVILLPNLFLRGEWEYIAFAKVDGIRSQVNTFRVGLGLKF